MFLWIIATIAAFYIKGLCGFANTLIFTSILSFGTVNINISPVELVLGLPSNIIQTIRNRSRLSPKIYIPLALLVIAGSIPGAFLLKNVDPRYIKVFFGFVVVLLGIEMLLRESSKIQIRESKIALGIIGFLSGVLCGLFGIGALLAAYVSRATKSNDEFKANIGAVFIMENLFRIVLYSVMGIITLASLKQSLILLPFMLLGLWLGIMSSKCLDEKVVKKAIIILLIISGFMMIITNL